MIFKKLFRPTVHENESVENFIGSKNNSSRPILYRLMLIVSIMTFIGTLGVGILLVHQQRHFFNDIFSTRIDDISGDFHRIIGQQTSGLSLAIQTIAIDKQMKKALREGDRERLLNDWQGVFETMKKENHLTHFYFLDKNRVCLLRVHNPKKYGDLIERFTAQKAEWTHQQSSGIEIGPLGTFTLRVVQPVYDEGVLIGYIELGKEIEDVLNALHERSNENIAVLVHKKYLNRQSWEEGMRMLGRETDWTQLPNDAIIYSSQKKLPSPFLEEAQRHTTNHCIHRTTDQEVTYEGKDWRVSMIPLKDASDKEIGDLMLMNDISFEKNEFVAFVTESAAIGMILMGTFLGLVFLLLRQMASNIRRQQSDLQESEERFEQLAEQSRTFIWEVDRDGKFTYVSDMVEKVLGYRVEEVVGQKYFYDLHPSEGKEGFQKIVREIFERKESFENLTNMAVTRDNELLWFTTNGIAMVDSNGNLLGYRGSNTDISERKFSEEKINGLAFFDQLTSLPNRILLLDRLKQAISASSRTGNYGALLFIDLDNFKTLNDTLGHDIGDSLLKLAAKRLSLCVREGDTVSRFGGDEFVVVLGGLSTDETDAATASELVSEKILASLNQPYFLGGINHRSTASIGITLFKGDSTSIDDLMKQADLAMYKSKDAGRNTLSFFDPNMEHTLKERAVLEEDLRIGIEEQQFILYYQAQVLNHNRIVGAEALVRWKHPKRGMVAPMEFISVAEETGLIIPLGEWILKTACVQLAQWSRVAEMADVSIAVNVSARQFRQSNFVSQVSSILQESGADPKKLKLELTESLLVQNVEDVIEKMVALKNIGVGFSLDDFGTGYSSLSYLKRLPLDQLKIDQSFVRDLLIDSNDAIICKSTIALAESMGLSVIAEGVETKEQRDALSDIGCSSYQGYWFSRPVPLDEFEALHKTTQGNDLDV
jgi:diguanylate cyclase (GGDEF)-like protein/PAS domain S-box-containing protein